MSESSSTRIIVVSPADKPEAITPTSNGEVWFNIKPQTVLNAS